MIHNMVIGGGSGKLFAVIAVTYPEGSVCTCTNGAKTLTARDTSGKALFNVPPGTWTVTATDGSKTKSVTVSITAEGQSESVTLTYELVLFDNGSYDDVTGGWNNIKNNLVYAEGYSGNQYEDRVGYFYTNNKIDLSDYNILHFMVKQSPGNKYKYVGYRNSQASDSYVGSTAITVEVSTPTEYTIDISSQTGSYYIGGDARGANILNGVYCSRVWLS